MLWFAAAYPQQQHQHCCGSCHKVCCCLPGASNTENVPHSQQEQREAMTDAGSSSVVGTDTAAPLDFRILTEPIAMQPNKSAYGVPYDLIDTSHGSAMSEMLQQLKDADTALTAKHLVTQTSKQEE